MLVYAVAKGYRHGSIPAGVAMLQELGKQHGFEPTVVDTATSNPNEDEVTAARLARYEIVFFMGTTGDVFNAAQEAAFEEWMTTKNGAFAGVHSVLDTESGWDFYKEVTGQYLEAQEPCCTEAAIEWLPNALDFVAVKGLPSPWLRREEWYVMTRHPEWSRKPGFKILGIVTTTRGSRPVSFVREWNNFRSFCTTLGHEQTTYTDPQFKKHVAAGVLWAVRREAQVAN